MIDKEKALEKINRELTELLGNERNMIANLANASALLFNSLPDVNWAGFYLMGGGELVLGPFQGKPACVRIPIGKGVCGSSARDRKTYLVDDVDEFPGYIACDSDSRSELVVPVIIGGTVFGVLDIDSPVRKRFDELDRKYMEAFVDILISKTDFIIQE
ncbi:MAG: GAF domain-containing protein [Halanaerobiaceae bacterium]|nr:GAF domain-containing protein [Halanaerobiaceae bacterium]